WSFLVIVIFFFFKQKTAYDIDLVTGVQTCALPIWTQKVSQRRAVHDQNPCEILDRSWTEEAQPRHDGELVRAQSDGREGVIIKRSEEHTSELQSPDHLVCRLLLEKKKNHIYEISVQ